VTTAYIELNDAGILQAVNGELVSSSPAYAVLDNNQLLLGNEARSKARLLPTWTNNRFWNHLSSDSIANATHNIRHHADLAFAHLENIWQPLSKLSDQVVIGVPGFYNQQQLGLLLGMAKEAKIPVAGIVDSALAAIASETSHTSLIYLDISLHRISLTQFQIDDQIRKTHHVNVTETGLFTLMDRWASVIAQQYIQSSRFDPMHDAKSEQVLFDRLPTWLIEGKNTFEMDIDGVTHSVQVPEDQLIHVGQSVYPKITEAIESLLNPSSLTSLFVSHRFKGFKGLHKTLETLKGLDLQYLKDASAPKTIHSHWDNIVSKKGVVEYVTKLPKDAKRTIEGNSEMPCPSHLLFNNRALLIGERLIIDEMNHDGIKKGAEHSAFTLTIDNKQCLLQSHTQDLRLNGQVLQAPTALKLGDQISLHNQTATLIAVT
jgi:hypothetical protein